jgi:hypothetical protein
MKPYRKSLRDARNGETGSAGLQSVRRDSRIFVGRSFSYDTNTAKSVRLQPLKYGFCSRHTEAWVLDRRSVAQHGTRAVVDFSVRGLAKSNR